jgi:8-oxo-dGTP pyrophosphatase MutT (NUDIX family)
MIEQSDFQFNLVQSLQRFKPKTIAETSSYAAVLVPVLLEREPEILLTVRSAHLKSHPGEVSFPGGMYEPADATQAQTALRETHEEVGVEPRFFKTIGQLSPVVSRAGFRVFPIVAIADKPLQTHANEDEIAEIFTVPWQFFATEKPELKKVSRGSMQFYMPHFYFENKHIWGLTAMVLLELVNLVEGTDWPLPDFSEYS